MLLQDARVALGLTQPFEWADVRKAFARLALETHPDRPNGDPVRFRLYREAHDALKSASEDGISLDAVEATPRTRATHAGDFSFAELWTMAKEQGAQMFKVEAAKSGAGRCAGDGEPIAKGELRV